MARGTRHEQALAISSRLTQTFRRMYQREAAMITPEEVIEVLNEAKVDFVLMGAHGIGGWLEQARASEDVDVLVRKTHHRRAIQAIRRAFPNLGMDDFLVVTRFKDAQTAKVVIDLMKPTIPVHQAVFRHVAAGGENYFVPDLEMALATKFAAMTSPNRDERKKHLDASDFIGMVQNNREAIDRKKLRRLGNKVYPDGGTEILQLVDDVLAGRRIRF